MEIDKKLRTGHNPRQHQDSWNEMIGYEETKPELYLNPAKTVTTYVTK